MQYFNGPAQRIGWLFVVATVAGVSSVVTMSSTLGDDDLLPAVYSRQGSLIIGEMLIFVMLVAMVGTAVLLAPVIRKHSETLAVSYVLARTLEVAMIAVGMVAGLLLVPLSWDYAAADGGDTASAGVLAESLEAAGDRTGYLGAQMIFSISALVLNWAFLRNGLIPRLAVVVGPDRCATHVRLRSPGDVRVTRLERIDAESVGRSPRRPGDGHGRLAHREGIRRRHRTRPGVDGTGSADCLPMRFETATRSSTAHSMSRTKQ